MYFAQHYLSCLAHASYVLGSGGIAAVVDPRRDVVIYLEDAAREGLKIAWIVETHLHADFVSGHRELAEKTGARILVSRSAGALFDHVPVADGDEVAFGRCRLRFLETPGHTPESICVLVTDLDRGPEPVAVLTGDTLFIGDTGRPDLSRSHTPQQLAAMLHTSLQKLLALPDGVAVWPAHGAGSLCGRNIGSERSSTIGRERAMNPSLRPMPTEEFVRRMTADLPERPRYFARDAEINRMGADSMAALQPLAPLTPAEIDVRLAAGAVLLDVRPADEFGAGHVPGSLQIGLAGQFAAWAGTLLGPDAAIVLVAGDETRADEARTRLARVGIDGVAGYLAGGVAAWAGAGRAVATVSQIAPRELWRRLSDSTATQTLDVRRRPEWEAGHLQRARNVPLDRLERSLDGLDPHIPAPVHCAGGYRSSIAASLLLRAGFRDVANVVGGFEAWRNEGLPVVSEA